MRTNARASKDLAAFPAPDVSKLRSWKNRGRALKFVRQVLDNHQVHEALRPHLEEFDAWLEASAQQISGLAGVAGPIECAVLTSAAMQFAWAHYWLSEAMKLGPAADKKDIQAANALLDSAKNNAFAALELAVRSSRALQSQPGEDAVAALVAKDSEEP